nr:B39 [uncultured bacterium]
MQQGDQARSQARNQGYYRGLDLLREGPDDAARTIGLEPSHSITGNTGIQGEAVYLETGAFSGHDEHHLAERMATPGALPASASR